MKKISNILLAVTFALPLFTACETDNDSNPTLNEPDTSRSIRPRMQPTMYMT